jgi:hypothetical protein
VRVFRNDEGEGVKVDYMQKWSGNTIYNMVTDENHDDSNTNKGSE